jgi:hypothetical protein
MLPMLIMCGAQFHNQCVDVSAGELESSHKAKEIEIQVATCKSKSDFVAKFPKA